MNYGVEEESELGKEKGKERTDTVPFYKLFAFADVTDYMLMMIGSVSAMGNGLSMPLMNLLLGDLINSFGQTQSNTNHIVDVVSKVCVLYIGIFMKLKLRISCTNIDIVF
ncbi:putative ABC transporter type 1, transmembrane domain superfamily [Helianthus annuus]|nr:putative ABC transporter type 1, transmembrane domain superfamily [Helianthus annuus]